MGEARYYGRLILDRDVTQEDIDLTQKFLEDIQSLYNDWQNCRSDLNEFPALWDRHSDTLTALGVGRDLVVGPAMNELAGIIDSPTDSDDFEIFELGQEIRFCGTVWHFADWDKLGNALVKLVGACRFAWASDEYMAIDPWEYVD